MRGFSSSVPYLRSLCKEADIIAVSEHWLHENMLKQFEVSEKLSYCARSSKFAQAEHYGTKRGQGGVALLWRNSVGGISQISDLIHDRMCGIRLQTCKNLIVNILSVYLYRIPGLARKPVSVPWWPKWCGRFTWEWFYDYYLRGRKLRHGDAWW